ncbi:MAG: hypothetical protein CFH38_01577, partial [Alphaproteobacteria bacterium MarineAlpha10_Bin1]
EWAPGRSLGEDAGREIRLTLSQLQMQGLIESVPRHCFVWVADEEAAPTAEELGALGIGFGGTAAVAAKPAPVLPAKMSQLLPADVRAAVTVFQPQAPAVAALTKRLKESFDPVGVLNSGRMYAGV